LHKIDIKKTVQISAK